MLTVHSNNKHFKAMKTSFNISKTLTTNVFILGLLAINCLLFQQCQKSDNYIQFSLGIPEEYNEVGKIHNEGLDYIFEAIQEKCIDYAKNCESYPLNPLAINYLAVAQEATIDFCRTNPKTKDNSELCEVFVLKSGLGLKSSKVLKIKPEQQNLFDELQMALKIEYSKKNLKELKSRLDEINKKASAELSESDAGVIYCATSTAYNTYQYWNNNFRAWYFALNYPEIFEKYKKAELNEMKLKSVVAISDTTLKESNWIKNCWDNVEGWFFNTTDAIEEWWDRSGEAIIIADCIGAIMGIVDVVETIGPSSLVFGPEGLVVVGTTGAIIEGIDASCKAIIGSGIVVITNP